MNDVTARLAEMLAANAASDVPEDSEIVAGEVGASPLSQAIGNFNGATMEGRAESSSWAAEHPHLCTGRGPSGRLRNFRAMSDVKLRGVMSAVWNEDNDPEAISAAHTEMGSRGL